MTTLLITPKVENKTARFKGTVAAGEHVAVTIKGGADWSAEGLTLRVIDLTTHRTLAVFPRPEETLAEGETPDAWDTNAGDLTCTLNLNTTRMVAAARHMIRVPVMFVLGNSSEDERTLYFRDCYDVELWPERIGDTAPYDLDKWPKQIDEWTELVSGFGETLDGHIGDNVKHITALERAAWNGKVSPSTLAAYVNAAAYDTVTKKILLKNGNSIVSEIDASDFVKDGMVSSVAVVGGNLVITFNTDAGKSPISIPLSDFAVQQVQSDWNQQDSSKKDFIKNKPTIPAPVDVSGKMDGAAAYPAWDAQHQYGDCDTVSYGGRIWFADGTPILGFPPGEDAAWNETSIGIYLSIKQDSLSPAQLAAANSGATAAKVAVWDGYAAQIAAKANASEVNAALALKADAANLPYALVVPGEDWRFSGAGVQTGVTYTITQDSTTTAIFSLYADGIYVETVNISDAPDLQATLYFEYTQITATRTRPCYLADRAVNAVAVSTDTTLTLPAENPGKARDLIVRLTVSATSAVTWTVAQGESWDAMGAPPSSFAAGTYLYRFTEVEPGTWHCEDMLALIGLEAALAAINGGVAP